MKKLSVLFLLLALGIFSIGANNISKIISKPIWLGIVRVDGALIPFAQYDGKKWTKPWPEAGKEVDVKLTSNSLIPKSWLGSFDKFPESWFFNSKNKKNVLAIKRPKLFGSHCISGWGISTNYSPVKKECESVEKAGLAANIDLDVRFPIEINLKTEEGKSIFSYLKRIFEKREEEKTKKYKSRNGVLVEELIHQDGTPVLADTTIPVEKKAGNAFKFSRVNIIKAGANVYFFNIWRAYRKYNPDTYSIGSEMKGWIIRSSDGKYSMFGEDIYVLPFDETRIVSLEVLGSVHIGEKDYQIVANYYYESESYSVIEIKENKILTLVDYDGGGC